MKKLFLISIIITFSGCASNFVGNIPSESVNGVRFITGNEVFSKNEYRSKAIVVVTRDEYFWDFFGLIKKQNDILGKVFTDDLKIDLAQKVRSLDCNAVTDIQIINFSYTPGGILYFLPLGYAHITIQATALKLNN
tara:strand:+ start:494 stop:901 length:408 start_codon:yes stop_codon:yes gene_type:complete